MHKIDVTDQVTFGLNDGESLPLTKCVCGKTFNMWDNIIHCDDGWSHDESCLCGRKLVFSIQIHVYEIHGDPK
jgi:hypothetical protein